MEAGGREERSGCFHLLGHRQPLFAAALCSPEQSPCGARFHWVTPPLPFVPPGLGGWELPTGRKLLISGLSHHPIWVFSSSISFVINSLHSIPSVLNN